MTAPAGGGLPEGFADLEPWAADWALETEEARAGKRVSTPIAKLREFHAATFPRMDAVMVYLNTLPNDPGALASRDKCLFALAQMVMEASAPMDLQWDTSDIEDVFPMERMKFLSLPSR